MPSNKNNDKQACPNVWNTYLASNKNNDESLASWLRQVAIEHLKSSKTPVAQGFRGEYVNMESDKPKSSVSDFLEKQARPGAWGTYIEACALAEKFKVHLMVTDHVEGRGNATYCLYRAENLNAPVVHLHNYYNQHWTCEIDNKIINNPGKGNCLYYAFVPPLKKVRPEILPIPRKAIDARNSIEISPVYKEAKSLQQQRYQEYQELIKKVPSPNENGTWENHIKTLLNKKDKASQDILAQIQKDHDMALRLALNERNNLTGAQIKAMLYGKCNNEMEKMPDKEDYIQTPSISCHT